MSIPIDTSTLSEALVRRETHAAPLQQSDTVHASARSSVSETAVEYRPSGLAETLRSLQGQVPDMDLERISALRAQFLAGSLAIQDPTQRESACLRIADALLASLEHTR